MLRFWEKAVSVVLVFVIMIGIVTVVSPLEVSAAGTTYYVDSANGSDSNNGTSISTAWKTLTKVNSVTYSPGDKILFKAGGAWSGTLSPSGSGTDGSPIIIDMYGSGNKPFIDGSGTSYAVYLKNQEYWEIKNLEIINDNYAAGQAGYGIRIEAEDYGIVNHIHIINCDIHDVSGLNQWRPYSGGIFLEILGSTTPTKFNNVLIEGCSIYNLKNAPSIQNISGWYNRESITDGVGPWYPSTNYVVRNNYIYNERTSTYDQTNVTMRVCKDAVFEHNVINGVCASGMYYFNAEDCIMQFNESYGIKLHTGNANDGSGLDIDYNQSGTIVQYNYVHDNAQEGFNICANGTNGFNRGAIIRYNISQNETEESIQMAGPVSGAEIYNNVFYVKSDALRVFRATNWGGYPTGTKFYNNIIYNNSPSATYELSNTTDTVFDYNCFYGYHPSSEPFDAHKITADPMLIAPGTGGIGRDTCDGYKLASNSPLIDAGRVVSNNGGQDYWGNPVLSDRVPDIGVHDAAPGPIAKYVINGDFETGSQSPWISWNNSGVTTSNIYAGSYSGYVTKISSLEQVITGLSYNTQYTYTAWVKTENPGDWVSMGVKDYGGTEITTQITSDSYQKYSITFTTGSTHTTAKIYLYKSEATGSGMAFIDNVTIEKTTVQPTCRFDMGTASSVVEAGYTQVTDATQYSSGNFGWVTTPTNNARDRASGDALQRDFVFDSSARTFKVDLSNGSYAVKILIGDADYEHDQMIIKANGITKASGITTSAGQWIIQQFDVDINGGSLLLEFSDGGGNDANWVVNAIEID